MSSQGITIERMNHLDSVIQVFERLLESSSLVDCTIAAEGQYLKAHKVVLSACSPYFELLFSQENTNPIVLLKDVKFEDLKAVINFIYRGKVQIPENQLSSFVNTIESLHVRGMEPAEQCLSDVKNAPEGSPVVLQPDSKPLVETDVVMEQGIENQFGTGVVSEESDTPCSVSQPPPLVEGSPVHAQFVETFAFSQFGEKCEAESSIKIIGSWSECSNEVENKVDMEETPILISDEKNYAKQLTAMHIDEEEEKVDVEETSILISDEENYAKQLTATHIDEEEEKVDVEETPILISDEENYAKQLTTALIGQEEEKVDVEETPILENSEHNAKEFTAEANNSENEDDSAGVAPDGAGGAPSNLVVTLQETEATTDQNAATSSCEEGSVKKVQLLTEQNGKVPPFSCAQCDKTFIHRKSLISHQIIHTGKRPFVCTQCLKSFTHRKSLISHQNIHTGKRPYVCTQCPKSFRRKSHLKRHQYTHSEQRPFTCTECPKSFASKNYLIVHNRIHTGQRPFSCTECDKSFSVKNTLMEHLRVHAKQRPFACTLCEKSFKNKCNLTAHQRIHTGQRFSCDICDKSFSVKHTLKVHQRTHTGQRPFSCDNCDKSFRVRQSLVEHQRTHTKQRPFSCPLCEKSFSNSSNLTAHKRTHTGQQPFSCAHCDSMFSRKSSLAKHLQIHKER